MEFTEAVRRRRMTRSYDPNRPVPPTIVTELLRLAVRAPSAGHTQGRHFLVLDDITSRAAFWSATSDGPADTWRAGMQSAPVLILCFSDKQAYLDRYAEPDKGWSDRSEHRWPVPFWDVDTGMAALIMLLGATDRGMAACLFGVPGERWTAVRSTFSVPSRLTPVCVVSLGYPAPNQRSGPLRRRRRPLNEVVHYGSFSGWPSERTAPLSTAGGSTAGGD